MATATLAGGFTYANVSVTSVTPNTGSTDGGTSVAIAGGGFNEYAIVYFGGQLLQNITVVSDHEITGTTPPNVSGACTITVTQIDDSAALADGFTYIQAIQVSSIYPAQALTTGGEAVTIYGAGFTGSPTVTIGGASATSIVVSSSTTITCDTPAGTAGYADVVVNGVTLANALQYILPLSISNIQPNADFSVGGKSIAITGYGFNPNATITIGGTSLEDEVVQSNTVIVGTVPAGTAGLKNVVVTKGGDDYTITDGFTYISNVDLTSIAPSSGSFSGGTSVTVSGSNFLDSAIVTIAGIPLTSQIVASSTTITGSTPAGVSGSADVVIQQTSAAGVDIDTLADAFTYSADDDGRVANEPISQTYENILRLEDGLQDTEQDVVTQTGDVTPIQISRTSVTVSQPFDAIIKFDRT